MTDRRVTITECPRDAFQGLRKFIPTEEKIAYMNSLVAGGLRRIDFGSFVSPKAVPQMADSAIVFENMDKPSDLYLIGIIGNERGLEGLLACNGKFKNKGRIHAAGYPLSVSEQFQRRNIGRTIDESWDELARIIARGHDHGVDVIVYLSMAFGNPYGETHDANLVVGFARRLRDLGARAISLADTIGGATPEMIAELFTACVAACPEAVFTAHFHSTPESFAPKIDAALAAGCRMIDAALGGVGGCPFAEDALTGNVNTLALVEHLEERGFETGLDAAALRSLSASARAIAARYA